MNARNLRPGLTVVLFALVLTVIIVLVRANSEIFVGTQSAEWEVAGSTCSEAESLVFGPCESEEQLTRLIVFTRASVFTHDSIPAGKDLLDELSAELNIALTYSEDPDIFSSNDIDLYDGAIFLNTDSVVFDTDEQKQAFQSFIEQGRDYVGIHGASATHWNEDKWDWYRDLVGQRFVSHPVGLHTATVLTKDTEHPSTAHLDESWETIDEWYDFEGPLPETATVLLEVDSTTYPGAITPNPHPIAWYQEWSERKSWYTALGHASEQYMNPDFVEHVRGGIIWAFDIPTDEETISTQ